MHTSCSTTNSILCSGNSRAYGGALLLVLFLWLVCSRLYAGEVLRSVQPGLLFVENRGQLTDYRGAPCPDIRYTAHVQGQEVYLRTDGISIVTTHYRPQPQGEKREQPTGRSVRMLPVSEVQAAHRVDMQFAGCNPHVRLRAERPAESYNNYYLKHCPQGILRVPLVDAVRYEELYPHIDLLIYTYGAAIKYDFIVRPGGNPDDIRMKIAAADSAAIIDGALRVFHPLGCLAKDRPYTYQILHGDTVVVPSTYVLTDSVLTFDIGPWDSSAPLVIDPVTRFWSTYYGGSRSDDARGVATDRGGNVYIVGATESLAAIVTPGAFQPVHGGGEGKTHSDMYIAKFDPAGRRLWGTYFGSNGNEIASSVVIAPGGTIVLAGNVDGGGGGLATPGTHQQSIAGGVDGVLAEFGADGRRLWCTYYGGGQNDRIYGVACTPDGRICIAGETAGASGMGTSGTHQIESGGGSDGFVAAFDGTGRRLWSTYVGGGSDDWCTAIAVEADTAVYVTGITASADRIATPSVFQTAYRGSRDGFVARFNGDGTRAWGSYYGDERDDLLYAITTDGAGNCVVAGSTFSWERPTYFATTPAYQDRFRGIQDGILAGFSGATGMRMWGTYLGGFYQDELTALAGGTRSYFAVTGYTSSAGLQSHSPSFHGVVDGIVARFTYRGGPMWVTYFGGEDVDEMYAAACDSGNALIICGLTTSTTAVATIGAHQTQLDVTQSTGISLHIDACIAKLVDECYILRSIERNVVLCAGQSRTLDNVTWAADSLMYEWSPPDGLSAVDVLNPTIQASVDRTYHLTITSTTGCVHVDSVRVTLRPPPTVNAGADQEVCSGQRTQLAASVQGGVPPYTYRWSPPELFDDATQPSPAIAPVSTASYVVEVRDGKGCVGYDTVLVAVRRGLSAAVSVVDFGRLDACTADSTIELTLSNTGEQAVRIGKGVVSSDDFALLSPAGEVHLPVGGSVRLVLRFAPTGTGATSATVSFTETLCGGSFTLLLKGEKTIFAYTVPQATVELGTVPACLEGEVYRSWSLRNTGTDTLYLDGSAVIAPVPFSVQPSERVFIPPGEERSLRILYTSSGTPGTYSETITIPVRAGTCRDDIAVPVSVVVVEQAVTLVPRSVVLPPVTGCGRSVDTTLAVTNVLPVPLTITAVAPSPLLMAVTPLPMAIPPGATRELVIRCTPQTAGTITAQLLLAGDLCPTIATVQVEAEKDGMVVTVPDTVDFGTVAFCKGAQFSTSCTVESSGTDEQGTIVEMTLDGPFTTDFRVGDVLEPHTSMMRMINVALDTQAPDGEYTGVLELRIAPCDILRRIELRAHKQTPKLSAPSVYTIGTLDAGQSTTAQIRYRNTGTVALRVEQADITAPFVVEYTSPVLPVDLEPQQELIVQVRYNALPGASSEDLVVTVSQPCSLAVRTAVEGRGDADSSAAIVIGSVTAFAGQVVDIPVVVSAGTNLPPTVRRYTGEILFDYTLLEPLEYPYTVMGTTGTLVFTGDVPSGNDTLVRLRFQALLGTSRNALLLWKHFAWENHTMQMRLEPGVCTLIDTCGDGGRAVTVGGASGLGVLAPNPAGDRVVLIYNVVEDGPVVLHLLDLHGRTLQTVVDAPHEPGQYTVEVDLRTCAGGVYYLALRTPTRMVTAPLHIVR